MARVKGRDVLLELMDSVEGLQATAAEHADLLASLAGHMVSTSAEMTALAGQVAHVSRHMSHVSQRMDDVSQRMDDVSQRMDDVSQRMDDIAKRTASMEVDFQTLAQNSVESAKLARTLQQQLGRTAKLLGEFAGGSKNRFETIEDRLDRLERKAG